MTPSQNGYSVLLDQSALVIQDPDFSDFKKTPPILVLGVLNSPILEKIKDLKIRELNYPDQDKKPEYLKTALDHFKKQHISTHIMRQNSFVPLGNVEMIVLAPHDKSVYDETSRLTFKLILGRKSFVLAPILDESLMGTLLQSYGKDGLRTDFLIVSKLQHVSRKEVSQLFGNPKIIVMSETEPKTPLHFEEVF